MKNFVETITLKSRAECEFFDITEQAQKALEKSQIQNGLLTVFTQHTTTAVVINEKEAGLQKDMALFLNRLAPMGKNYEHDRDPQDGRINAHSHLQSLCLPTSQIIPVVNGKMSLGKWQCLFFIECDGPREARQCLFQVIGL